MVREIGLRLGIVLLGLSLVATSVRAADGEEEEEVVVRETPSLDLVIDSVRQELSRVQPSLPVAPERALINFRQPQDVKFFGQLHTVVTSPKNEAELRRVLGDHGYFHLVEIAKAVSSAGQRDHAWREVRQAIEGHTASDMEGLQAKRLVVEWLRRQELVMPSTDLSGVLAVLTVNPSVVAPEADRVLSRVEEAFSHAKPLEMRTVLHPAAQLIAFSPYLPSLSQGAQDRILGRAFELASANTDKSQLEIMEYYLTGVVFDVSRDRRINTVLGSMASFAAGTRYLRHLLAQPEYLPTAPGAVLTAFHNIFASLNTLMEAARKNNWTAEIDLVDRARWELRKLVLEIASTQPSVRQRLPEFELVRGNLGLIQIHEDCASAVANPLPLLTRLD